MPAILACASTGSPSPLRTGSPLQAGNNTGSAAASTSNPYTTNLDDRQPAVEASVGIGGIAVRAVDKTIMPGLSSPNLSTHLVKLGACTSLAPHYHPTADELQYVLQGKRARCARRAAQPGAPPPPLLPAAGVCATAPQGRRALTDGPWLSHS